MGLREKLDEWHVSEDELRNALQITQTTRAIIIQPYFQRNYHRITISGGLAQANYAQLMLSPDVRPRRIYAMTFCPGGANLADVAGYIIADGGGNPTTGDSLVIEAVRQANCNGQYTWVSIFTGKDDVVLMPGHSMWFWRYDDAAALITGTVLLTTAYME